MSRRNRIRTLLYGDQRLQPGELDLISTPSLQRLYDLHQLGLADRVFLDASHSRLHHVVGVLEQVEKLTNAIIRNLQSAPSRKYRFAIDGELSFDAQSLATLVEKSKPIARLIGLLHDLTHAPFGHTVEDEIELIACKHDDPDRQADAFYRLLCQYIGWIAKDADIPKQANTATGNGSNGSDLFILDDLTSFLHRPDLDPPRNWKAIAKFAVRLLTDVSPKVTYTSWRLTPQEMAELLAQLHTAMTALLHIELLHKNNPETKHFPKTDGYDFQKLIDEILQGLTWFDYKAFRKDAYFQPNRDAYLLDIVGNTVCADLLDYARRDAHFTNIKLDYDEERIAENFTIVSWDAATYPGDDGRDRRYVSNEKDPFSGPCLRTAISLFSHKFRIDVPGELMNLLNVRFYIYERVLFHPTKCAAGAMLGTALQLIGWRPLQQSEENAGDLLPSRLRHIGDTVFLNDVAAGARLALEILSQLKDSSNPEDAVRMLDQYNSCPQVQLAQELINRRTKLDIEEAKAEIRAGLDLLDRLRARRYFRAVFRALPNARYEDFDRGANDLADAFRDAQRRYQAERSIEKKANLRPGSVVIHCPPRKPAQKIANVLLCLPRERKDPIIRKLRHINEIDKEVFGHHHEAIKAVEDMYASMWRLVIYVSPRYLSRYKEIAQVAGKVIIQTLNDTLHMPLEPNEDAQWPNDPQLERELNRRLERQEKPAQQSVPISLQQEEKALPNLKALSLMKTLKEMAKEHSPALLNCLNNPQFDPEAIKSEILSMGSNLSRKSQTGQNGGNLGNQFIATCRTSFGKRLPSGMGDKLTGWYNEKLSTLANDEQIEFLNILSQRIEATPESEFMRPQQPFLNILDDVLEGFRKRQDRKED